MAPALRHHMWEFQKVFSCLYSQHSKNRSIELFFGMSHVDRLHLLLNDFCFLFVIPVCSVGRGVRLLLNRSLIFTQFFFLHSGVGKRIQVNWNNQFSHSRWRGHYSKRYSDCMFFRLDQSFLTTFRTIFLKVS